MNDPRRLRDEYAGDLEGRLLRSVQSDAPRSDAHRRTLVALGLGGATLGIPAATTAAAAAKVGSTMTVAAIIKWIGVGVGAAVVTVGAVYETPKLLGLRQSTVVEHAPPPSAVAGLDRAEPSPLGLIEPSLTENGSSENHAAPAVPRAPENLPPTNPARQPHAMQSQMDNFADLPPPSINAEPNPPGLSQEVAMLDTARQTVSSDPVSTLHMLDNYEARFPRGDLAPEALVLRIEALVRSGQRAAAEKLAREYLARNPGSPHARKIGTLIGAPVGPSQ
jgi:hypothetical protein